MTGSNYFLIIRPVKPDDPDSKDCLVTVTKDMVVYSEPILADGANDIKAIRTAREDAAKRLGISVADIGY